MNKYPLTARKNEMKPKLFDKFGNSLPPQNQNPSLKFDDKSDILSKKKRTEMIDFAGELVSQNKSHIPGRPTMCLQFAMLIKHMLAKEEVDSEIYTGKVKYTNGDVEYQWEHFWVETDNSEIVDCNIDSMMYHYQIPEGIEPNNYWGKIDRMPTDRKILSRSIFDEKEIKKLEEEDEETIKWKRIIDEKQM